MKVQEHFIVRISNVVVFHRIWMQAIGLDRMQPGGTPVAACTVFQDDSE